MLCESGMSKEEGIFCPMRFLFWKTLELMSVYFTAYQFWSWLIFKHWCYFWKPKTHLVNNRAHCYQRLVHIMVLFPVPLHRCISYRSIIKVWQVVTISIVRYKQTTQACKTEKFIYISDLLFSNNYILLLI